MTSLHEVRCPYCSGFARLVTGARVYPGRQDLAEKLIWVCEPCDARVGCHGSTAVPLGILANASLRDARMKLHNLMLDPLWKKADECGLYSPEDEAARIKIRKAARNRVYGFLAFKLGIDRKQCHSAMFDIERCRDAWRALAGVGYPQIREWAQERKIAKQLAEQEDEDDETSEPLALVATKDGTTEMTAEQKQFWNGDNGMETDQ